MDTIQMTYATGALGSTYWVGMTAPPLTLGVIIPKLSPDRWTRTAEFIDTRAEDYWLAIPGDEPGLEVAGTAWLTPAEAVLYCLFMAESTDVPF